MGIFDAVTKPAGRVARHAQNLLEVARYGGLVTGEAPAEFEVIQRSGHHRLRHYSLGLPADAPAILLVPPLMVSTEVFDVSPQASAVRTLAANGVQSFVVDFGSPENEPGGLDRTIEDHVLAVDEAITLVREVIGSDVHISGYSQGGMFCYQTAAYRRTDGVASITVFGSPVDLRGSAMFKLPPAVTNAGAPLIPKVLGGRSIPGWMTRLGFQALDPIGAVAGQLGFLWALHDRDSLLAREGQRRFLMRDGWVAFPGPALEYLVKQFVQQNRMLQGGFDLAGRAVSLADITCPVLTFVGEVDEIAPQDSVRAIRKAAPLAEVYESSLPTGHFGLVVGSAAMSTTWPRVASWVRFQEGEGALDAAITSVPTEQRRPARERLEHNLELATSLAQATGRNLASSSLLHPVPALKSLAAPVAQVPRLAQLLGVRPTSQHSLAQAFDQAAQRAPSDVGFLYIGTVFNYADINERVDRVMRGLVASGVQPGEHIGVLMDTRPTALALVVALNRMGAVAVLLRPDGDTALEAKLGEVTWIITDPANESRVPDGIPSEVFLLRGGPTDAEGINRLEVSQQIDLPEWFRRNPGRANDLAFVLFNGSGKKTRMVRVTNGRWALAAYGTASAAQLGPRDTLLSVSPLTHTAGLLTAIGGAVAGHCRIAWLSSFEPDVFWEEVRRYGVTAVSYTWSQLAPLVDAEPHPAEANHSIRLFLGAGLPRGLWRRLTDRFAPAGVLEFWGSAERGVVLINVSGAKVGAVGRPLPGAATVRLGRYSLEKRDVMRDANGLVLPAAPGDLGLMYAQDNVGLFHEADQHDVFAPGDTWQPTASLFRRDGDGDYWLEGVVHDIVDTAAGPALPGPVATVFGELPQVSTAVAYGRGDRLCVALDTLRDIGPASLTAAAWRLPEASRPSIVHVVDAMPLTTDGRPDVARISARKLLGKRVGAAWCWDEATTEYRPLVAADLESG